VGHAACGEEKRNVYMILVGKPETRRPLGKPRCGGRQNDSISYRNRMGRSELNLSG